MKRTAGNFTYSEFTRMQEAVKPVMYYQESPNQEQGTVMFLREKRLVVVPIGEIDALIKQLPEYRFEELPRAGAGE